MGFVAAYRAFGAVLPFEVVLYVKWAAFLGSHGVEWDLHFGFEWAIWIWICQVSIHTAESNSPSLLGFSQDTVLPWWGPHLLLMLSSLSLSLLCQCFPSLSWDFCLFFYKTLFLFNGREIFEGSMAVEALLGETARRLRGDNADGVALPEGTC